MCCGIIVLLGELCLSSSAALAVAAAAVGAVAAAEWLALLLLQAFLVFGRWIACG